MRYRNIKTGIEFTSNCAISGADFEEIKAAPKAEPKEVPQEKPKAEVKAEPKPKTTTKRSKK